MARTYRPGPRIEYAQRRVFAILDAGVSGTVTATQDDDVAAIAGTFTDPPYGDGGIRFRVQMAAYRRPASEAYYQRHAPFPPPESYTATVAVTQADDTAAVAGTFTDPAYGDGGVRARVQQAAYRRPASEAYYQRHTLNLPQDATVVATITVTQDDDTASIAGTFLDPQYGDGGVRARAQAAAYRRPASEAYYQRRPFNLPQDTTVVASVTATQDDDVAAISGMFTDPPYLGDGGIRARVQCRRTRTPSLSPFQQRRTFAIQIPATVTATIGVTQDDDVASITGTFSDGSIGSGVGSTLLARVRTATALVPVGADTSRVRDLNTTAVVTPAPSTALAPARTRTEIVDE